MFVFVLTIIMCALGLGFALRAAVFNGVKGAHCLAELPTRYFVGFCIGMLFLRIQHVLGNDCILMHISIRRNYHGKT